MNSSNYRQHGFRAAGLLLTLAAYSGCGVDDPSTPNGSEVPTSDATSPVKQLVQVQDLGTFGGSFALGFNVNNRFQAIGMAGTPEEFSHPFVWTRARGLRDLGTLGGVEAAADGINDRGDVVGGSLIQSNEEGHPFLWTAERGMEDLGSFGGPFGAANSINDQRQAVGESQNAEFRNFAFIWERGIGLRKLGTLGGPDSEGSAKDINNAGQVVGVIALDGFFGDPSFRRAFVWTARTGMRDLGRLAGDNARAFSINQRGEIVGSSDDESGREVAVLWTLKRTIENLGTLGGSYGAAYGNNTGGVVVGESVDEHDQLFPFVWTKAGGMRRLPVGEVGGVGGAARAINDWNEIVGFVFLEDGTPRAVTWRPGGDQWTASTASAVVGSTLFSGRTMAVRCQSAARVTGSGTPRGMRLNGTCALR